MTSIESTDIRKALTEPLKKEERVVLEPSPRSPPTAPKPTFDKKSDAARYAALRNHRIRLEDAIDPDAERVSDIRKQDILFGRGKGFQNHPGNRRMRDIVEKYKIKYHTLRRTEKQDLIEAVYMELTENGARFLKKLDKEDVWVNVDRPVALQKVSHTLRCRKGVLDKVMSEKDSLPSPNLSSSGVSLQKQQSLSSSLAGLQSSFNPVALGGATSPTLEAQAAMPPAGSSLPALEAERLAALERFRALTTMPFVNAPAPAAPQAQTFLDHYTNNLRREQMIRELMVQQMQQEQMFSGTMGYMNHLGAFGAPSMVNSMMLPSNQ